MIFTLTSEQKLAHFSPTGF